MSNLQKIKCTKHDLLFAFDTDRIRALGLEPALMNCPVCALETRDRLIDQAAQLKDHRDLLLKAIDLKALLTPVDGA